VPAASQIFGAGRLSLGLKAFRGTYWRERDQFDFSEYSIEVDNSRDFDDYELTDDPMAEGEWIFVNWTWEIPVHDIDGALARIRVRDPRRGFANLFDPRSQRRATLVPFIGLRLIVRQNGSPLITSRVAFSGENSPLSNNLVELRYEQSRGVPSGEETLFRLWPIVGVLIHQRRDFVTKGAFHTDHRAELECKNHRLLEYSLEVINN
jgi:hypothetical protein